MNHKEVEASFENMNKIVGPEGPKADYFYRSAGVRTHYGVFLKCVDLLFKHGLEPDYSSGFLKSKQSKKGHIIFSAESDKEQWFDLIYNNRGWRQKWHLCLWNPRMEDAAEIYILSDITRAEPKDMIFERDRDALDPLPMYQGGPLPAPYVRANYCRISADNDYDSNWFKIVAQFQGKRDSLIYRG